MSHLADSTLIHNARTGNADDCRVLAVRLAEYGEIDERRLYVPAGYSSMYAWCMGDLRMSEDVACSRISAARTARQFPTLYAAVAERRLHLLAIGLLKPHLTSETVDELVAAATHKSKSEIEYLLAQRYPQPDLPTQVQAIAPAPSLSMGPAVPVTMDSPVSKRVDVRQVDAPAPRPKVTPLAPQRFGLQVTIDQSTHDKLRHAQALLGHQIPSGDVAQVLDRALDALISQLEKRKFAATDKPRPSRPRSTDNPRYISAEVKRAVRKRDGSQCTFTSETGHRCEARTRLEFDHFEPVARGGQSTAGNVRLRCRAHNQYEADCRFGRGLMSDKRRQARQASTAAHAARKQGPASGSVPTRRSW